MKNLLALRNLDPHPEAIILSTHEFGGTIPTEMQLLPIGKWDGYKKGNMKGFEITPQLVAAAVQNFNERKARAPQRDIVIDYEHQTLFGEIAPAAGWIPLIQDRGADGLWATGVKFTPKAQDFIKNGEYRYYSPAGFFNYPDKDTGNLVPLYFHSCALTNDPFIDQLKPLTAKDSTTHLYIFNSQTFQEEEHMEPLLLLLATFFSLAATAKPDDVVAKVNWLTEQLTAAGIVAKEGTVLTAQAVIDQIKLRFGDAQTFKANYALVAKALGAVETDPVEKLTALIASAKDRTGFVARTEFDALQLKIGEGEVDGLITAAMQKGKISPATRDTYRTLALKDRKAFTDLMAATAEYSVVPLQKIETSTVIAAKGTEPSETDLLIAKQLNVTKDQLAKVGTN